MDDLLNDLRRGCPWRHVPDGTENIEPNPELANALMAKAADEIELLRSALSAISSKASAHPEDEIYKIMADGALRRMTAQ